MSSITTPVLGNQMAGTPTGDRMAATSGAGQDGAQGTSERVQGCVYERFPSSGNSSPLLSFAEAGPGAVPLDHLRDFLSSLKASVLTVLPSLNWLCGISVGVHGQVSETTLELTQCCSYLMNVMNDLDYVDPLTGNAREVVGGLDMMTSAVDHASRVLRTALGSFDEKDIPAQVQTALLGLGLTFNYSTKSWEFLGGGERPRFCQEARDILANIYEEIDLDDHEESEGEPCCDQVRSCGQRFADFWRWLRDQWHRLMAWLRAYYHGLIESVLWMLAERLSVDGAPLAETPLVRRPSFCFAERRV